MNYIKNLFLLIFITICLGRTYSQQVIKTQDLGFWISANGELKFKKNYKFLFSQEFRLFENASELEKSITEIGLSYKINKNFRLKGNARYVFDKKKDKIFEQNFRYNTDLRYKWDINKSFDFKYRIRFQTMYKNLLLPNRKGTKSDFRHKISLDYKLTEIHKLTTSAEIWREFENFELPHYGKYRIMISDNIDSKIGDINLFFGVERDFDSNPKITYYITGLSYNFSL